LLREVSIAAGLAICLTAFALMLPASFLDGYDFTAMHGFYRDYLRTSLLAGEFPWWNPYTALGRPFFADIETNCAYPPAYLVMLLGVRAGVVASVALHCALAVWGCRRLALAQAISGPWSWLAGITFVLCGPVFSRLLLGQITVFQSTCWLPALWLAGWSLQERPSGRGLALLAATETACLLAGSPNLLWIGNCGMLVLLLGRTASARDFLRLLPWLAGAVVLAVALSAVQTVPFLELVAAGNRPLQDAGYASREAMGPTTWLSLALPANPLFPFAPEYNLHVGILLLFAAGSWTWLRPWNRSQRAWFLLLAVGVAFGSGDRLGLLSSLAEHLPGFGALRYPSRYGLLVTCALLFTGAAALARLRGPAATRALVAVHLAVLSLAAGAAALQYRTPATGGWEASLRTDLRDQGLLVFPKPPPRVAFPPHLVRPNSGLVAGYSTLDGFANPQLRTVWESIHAEAGLRPPAFALQQFDPAIFARGPVPVASAALDAGWDPKRGAAVFLSSGKTSNRARVVAAPGDATPVGQATFTRFSRAAITLEVQAETPALLVLAEPAYPGWHALVAGHETEIRPVEGWKRAVAIPAGTSTVQFWFRPRGILAALATTVAALFATAILLRLPAPRPMPATPTN
jgi:hypothetical protein